MDCKQDKDVKDSFDHTFRKDNKYLTFKLFGEDYGMEIIKVKEIIGMMTITAIPKAPSYVKGVINLRGKVIPVVDLRLQFGLEECDYTERTCIIVTETKLGNKTHLIGIIVDSVSEVQNIKSGDIDPCPEFGNNQVDTKYILGMAKTGVGIKILLDIDEVLAGEELLEVVTA
ncbi:MAG TPA: chemotaxis protein CheW [Syntrophales bacterium]|nr:chemotaxis protein CheW [Syntrophales bacterium]